MKNLSFLKGLAVGIGIAVVGGVVYANSVSSSYKEMSNDGLVENSWVVLGDEVYHCVMGLTKVGDGAQCRKVPIIEEYKPLRFLNEN
jgi:hypothetical protein